TARRGFGRPRIREGTATAPAGVRAKLERRHADERCLRPARSDRRGREQLLRVRHRQGWRGRGHLHNRLGQPAPWPVHALALRSGGHLFSGDATKPGTFTFAVKAAYAPEKQSSLQTYSITVTAEPPDTLVCSPDSNGGTLVNGVCVLPALHSDRATRDSSSPEATPAAVDHLRQPAAGPDAGPDAGPGRRFRGDHRRHSDRAGHVHVHGEGHRRGGTAT